MSPEQEANYAEALRRIREAEATQATTLSLHRFDNLTQLPREVERLTSLQSLDLGWCTQLRDLGPLAGLTSLQTLKLFGCTLSATWGRWRGSLRSDCSTSTGAKLLSDFEPLAGLSALRELDLQDCVGVRRFSPLEPLLPTLKDLHLFGCNLEDLPSGVCGEAYDENVLAKVRAHYEDLKSGQRLDAEAKVLFLGNGGTGKTQLCRRLRGEPFDPSVPTTHGIQLSDKTITLEGFDGPVRLNLWDFGGQEIYHGSHALFLQGQAAFLILWTPKLEQGSDCESGLTFQRRPLRYWLYKKNHFVDS